MMRRVERKVLREQWTRADEAHITPQYIQELRKLVERRRAKPFPERRETLGVGEKLTGVIPRIRHRPKLDQLELSISQADSRLMKEDRRPQPDSHEHRDNEQQRRPHRADEKNQREIQRAFSMIWRHQ